MNRRIGLYAALVGAALFAAGCGRLDPVRPSASPGNADFGTYVAMGTSISAGYQSGGLVETHQANSFPALFARQAGAGSFTYDRISPDGIQPLLRLVSIEPLVISNEGRAMGAPRDLAQATPYHNLGVPGAVLFDCDTTLRYGSNPFFALITRGQGSVLREAAALNPTFVSIEYGANEVLGAALTGSGTPMMDPFNFSYFLQKTLGDLHSLAPAAKIAIVTVPDVTTIPYVTTIKPYVVVPGGAHVPLIGPAGPLSENDYVLLEAQDSLLVGAGVPVPLGGKGTPLLDSQVLSHDEAVSLQAAVSGYNAAIAQAAADAGAAVVDLNGLLGRLAAVGYDFGGVHYSTAFVTGGLFSLDGVHPTDFGHGLIANTMIDAVNLKFGSTIPHVNLRDVATLSSSSLRQALPGEGVGHWPKVEGLERAIRPIVGAR